MIDHYKYCGIQECANGSKRIWGAASWIGGDGYSAIYLFWGSPKNPMIKKYVSHSKRPKSERLMEKILKKRKGWSGYTEIKMEEVREKIPELESCIGMHVLSKKLKFG